MLEDRLKIILEMTSIQFWKTRCSKIPYGEFVLAMSKNAFFLDFFMNIIRECVFSEPARKMTQNGGRVVGIGSMFDMNIKACVRNMEKWGP